MAKGKKVVVEVEDDELEELEDLEDLADEAEDADVEEEEEDEPDETPRRSRKTRKQTTKRRAAASSDSDTIGSADLAEALGTSGRELRVMLRQRGVKKNANNRYEWDSVDAAIEELGFDDLADAKEALAESRAQRLEELKERVGSKSKTAAAADEEDEDDEPAPAPRRRKKRASK